MGVHESHCCLEHGCKYGDKYCPVETGVTKQEYPCEFCEDPFMNEYPEKKLVDIDKVIEAIEAEPEFPGEMPKGMEETIKEVGLAQTMRIVVIATKKGILERVNEIKKE